MHAKPLYVVTDYDLGWLRRHSTEMIIGNYLHWWPQRDSQSQDFSSWYAAIEEELRQRHAIGELIAAKAAKRLEIE